jgi:hypothetical protein
VVVVPKKLIQGEQKQDKPESHSRINSSQPRRNTFLLHYVLLSGQRNGILLAEATPKKYAPTVSNKKGVDASNVVAGSMSGLKMETSACETIDAPNQTPITVTTAAM